MDGGDIASHDGLGRRKEGGFAYDVVFWLGFLLLFFLSCLVLSCVELCGLLRREYPKVENGFGR